MIRIGAYASRVQRRLCLKPVSSYAWLGERVSVRYYGIIARQSIVFFAMVHMRAECRRLCPKPVSLYAWLDFCLVSWTTAGTRVTPQIIYTLSGKIRSAFVFCRLQATVGWPQTRFWGIGSLTLGALRPLPLTVNICVGFVCLGRVGKQGRRLPRMASTTGAWRPAALMGGAAAVVEHICELVVALPQAQRGHVSSSVAARLPLDRNDELPMCTFPLLCVRPVGLAQSRSGSVDKRRSCCQRDDTTDQHVNLSHGHVLQGICSKTPLWVVGAHPWCTPYRPDLDATRQIQLVPRNEHVRHDKAAISNHSKY